MPTNDDIFTNRKEPLEPLSDSELAGIVGNELAVSQGSQQDDINSQRATALDYYFGRIPGSLAGSGATTNQTGIVRATEGHSNAVSLDVADMVEALLAQIMPSFSGDCVADFEAMNPEDEKQANIESQYVNHQIMQRSDGYLEFYQAVKNALLLKNGIVKVYVDEYFTLTSTEHVELSELERDAISMTLKDNQEAIFQEKPDYVCVKIKTHHKKLRVESVASEDFRVTSDQRTQNLMDDCDFCAQRMIVTQTWLLQRGVDPLVVSNLPTEDVDTDIDQLARNQSQEEDEHYWYEAGTRPIECWECYLRVDYDRDGYGELRRILMAGSGEGSGGTILENEEVDWIPYASGAPFLNPGRWLGISIFDKIKEIQDQKTDFIRQYINNMRYHNNRRLGTVENQVNLQDVTNSRPGGVIRCKSQGAVWEIPVSDIGPSCQNMLNYLDQMRAERGGASLDMQTQGMTVGGDTAHGVERQMSFKEMLASMITKTLGETLIKQTYLLAHRTIKRYMGDEQQARIGQDWLTVVPSQWNDRDHVSITVGLSSGERARQAGALGQVMTIQQQLMEQGQEGVLTDKSKFYNAVADFCRMSGLDNIAQYFIDPESQSAQMAAQQSAMMAQEQAMAAAQAQQEQVQAVFEIEQAKIQADVEKNLRQHELDVAKMLLESEEKQAEITQNVEELNERQQAIRDASAVQRLAR